MSDLQRGRLGYALLSALVIAMTMAVAAFAVLVAATATDRPAISDIGAKEGGRQH